jgi:hypothetical protein
LAFRSFKRVLRVRILPCPPYSLQCRELFSDFMRICRFPGLFIELADPKRALNYAASLNFSSFSLRAKSAVPFRGRQQIRKSIK